MAQHYPPATPGNVDHWLKWAREGYIAGNTEVEQLERAVEDALHGRYVNFDGSPVDHDAGSMAEPSEPTGTETIESSEVSPPSSSSSCGPGGEGERE